MCIRDSNTVDNTTQTGQESTTTKANAAKTGDVAPIAGLALLKMCIRDSDSTILYIKIQLKNKRFILKI